MKAIYRREVTGCRDFRLENNLDVSAEKSEITQYEIIMQLADHKSYELM